MLPQDEEVVPVGPFVAIDVGEQEDGDHDEQVDDEVGIGVEERHQHEEGSSKLGDDICRLARRLADDIDVARREMFTFMHKSIELTDDFFHISDR